MPKKNLEILKYDIFTKEQHSSKEDIDNFLDDLNKKINENSSSNKKKMSYSISPISQILIKKVSEESGATQGSIVESSPLLFAKIVLDSLERRTKGIETLKILLSQIKSSIKSFKNTAPHLEPYLNKVENILDEILIAEIEAVKNKNYQGIDSSDFESIKNIKNETDPPYNKEIENFLKDNELLSSLFNEM